MAAYKKQIEADKQFHLDRMEWLSSEKPTWSCGTVVLKSDVIWLINQSKNCLRLMENGYSTNSATT